MSHSHNDTLVVRTPLRSVTLTESCILTQPSEDLWEDVSGTVHIPQVDGGESRTAFGAASDPGPVARRGVPHGLLGRLVYCDPSRGACGRDCSGRIPSPCLHAHPLWEDGLEQGRNVMPLRGWPDSQIRQPTGHSERGQVDLHEGIRVLGTPLARGFCGESVLAEHSHRCRMCSQHGCCFFIVRLVENACHQIRVVRPCAVAQFEVTHNGTLWQCLQADLNQCDEVVRDVATFFFSMGGFGHRSVVG